MGDILETQPLSSVGAAEGLLCQCGARRGSATVAAEEERFRGLLEAAPDAMVIVDDTGTIRLVNAQTEALFGFQREELLGRPVELLIPHRFRTNHTRHRNGYASNRQVRPMGAGLDLHGLRKDGTEFPVEISLSPLETADGLLVSAAVRDVSDRKAAERRINELAALVESSQDAILAKTLDGYITYWNAAAQSLYGYTAEEVIGRHVSILAPEEMRDDISVLLERLRQGEKVEHFETLRVTNTGQLLDVDVTLWPTRDTDGTVVGACAIVRDISDRKRAEAELTALYEQQRHIALTLQRSLMGTPPAIPGLATAARYRPATQGAGVGGDWFDLIPLGAGRVGVLIGDVMGRGLEAAAVMGQLRSAAHALAKTGMQPRQLMQALDTCVADLDVPDQLVTCCYLIIAPDAGTVTVCSAGHLPILVAGTGEGVHCLSAPVNAPLGVGGVLYQQSSTEIRPGATLVLYTDGLIETPGSDIENRIGELTTVLDEFFTGNPCLETAAEHVLASLLPDAESHNDDVTLLLAQLPAAPLATLATDLPAVPGSVPEGRAFLTEALAAWSCADTADDALLLLSETLTNAVQHAEGPIAVHLSRTATDLTVEVSDRSPHLPQPRIATEVEESGRGLILVRALAESWGVRPTDEGKTTWFTLKL
ncbi:MEKHLA domain-containing protein [Streptomyces sp. HUCO-GS316]|uniref:PAS domain S-box protein n=1 Tax=Streptomyces sp. HUCO-GS316 TaxID=2692198 RepID=UPI00136C52BE|nr:PAS domain S-box protein [Streptomyces sp. HUCO-GS316]MXM65917.1 MEKHLA domain-containing protein [Streptomyces sp. HUCO-GS316]